MADVEIDWGSKIFWTAVLTAVLAIIGYAAVVFGFKFIMPTAEQTEQAAFLLTVLASIGVMVFRMVSNNKPSMIQAK